MRRSLCILALGLFLSSGCTRAGWQLAGTAVNVLAVTLQVAYILSYHDAHYHGAHCGHDPRYYDGRWNYHYHGHWEYYDPGTGGWYYYQ